MGSSRRQLLQTLGLASLGLAWRPQPAMAGAADPSLLQRLDVCSPHDDPLKALLAGNARFAAAWSRAAQEDDENGRDGLDVEEDDAFDDDDDDAFEEDDAEAVGTILRSNRLPELQEVTLVGNAFGDAGVQAVCDGPYII